MNLLNDYRNGKCEEVWKLISFLDYDKLDPEKRKEVDEIISETFNRIEYNTGVVFEILDRHGYDYNDFELPNPFGQRFVIGDKENWVEKAAWYYSDKSQPLKIPWVMAAFFARFKIIDFRGELTNFDRNFLLDALYLQAFDELELLTHLTRDIRLDGDYKVGFMFTPDEYHKENISGDGGPQILVNEKILIDNCVIDFTEEFELTFMDYLRFNFQWACLPNLAWCEDDEREPFEPILREVAKNLKPF
jgi:hypothetical protein